MGAEDSEQVEVNSPMTANGRDHPNPRIIGASKNEDNGGGYPFPSLGRQSSIYSLTLDEFQHTLCEGGKNFGSMNMDEFLNSIWTAEENQNQVHPAQITAQNEAMSNTHLVVNPQTSAGGRGIARQPSLARQGSLTLPPPLCRKTVDEVWSEIQKTQHHDHGPAAGQSQSNGGGGGGEAGGPSTGSAQQRQQTFGEMTLEDFLVKAGVVREQGEAGVAAPPPAPPPPRTRHQQAPAGVQYGMYQNGNNPQLGPTYGATPAPVMTMPGVYPAMAHNGGGESSTYSGGGGKRSNGFVAAGPQSGVCYGGAGVGVGNAGIPGGGYGAGIGMASPVSPLGSDGLVDCSAGHYGMDVGALRGRKRNLDGPVEKVVERRQRRMIKNRESAARSRARKQAYTVELEAELNQLREENAQLKQALAEMERQRNQQQYQEEQQRKKTTTTTTGRANKAQDRLRLMRRSGSCSL